MEISRADQDRWARVAAGFSVRHRPLANFAAEVVPVEIPGRKGPTVFDKGRA